jgi:hypothetical protein
VSNEQTNLWKISFNSKEGIFEWLVMPYVLTNGLTKFMQMLDDILNPLKKSFVIMYLDDILIFRKNWEEHLKHIQQVLGTLQQYKLYANLEKCSFNMKQMLYLGYIMDEKGVHVDPTKIQIIHDWLALKTMTELQSFLGLANFFYMFVFGFSHITWVLS